MSRIKCSVVFYPLEKTYTGCKMGRRDLPRVELVPSEKLEAVLPSELEPTNALPEELTDLRRFVGSEEDLEAEGVELEPANALPEELNDVPSTRLVRGETSRRGDRCSSGTAAELVWDELGRGEVRGEVRGELSKRGVGEEIELLRLDRFVLASASTVSKEGDNSING